MKPALAGDGLGIAAKLTSVEYIVLDMNQTEQVNKNHTSVVNQEKLYAQGKARRAYWLLTVFSQCEIPILAHRFLSA